MKVPTRPKQPNTRLIDQEKSQQNEAWYKLVVKIICWKDGLLAGGSVKFTDKITAKEWSIYSNRIVKINTTYGKQKVVGTLKETKEKIKKNGGFFYK